MRVADALGLYAGLALMTVGVVVAFSWSVALIVDGGALMALSLWRRS